MTEIEKVIKGLEWIIDGDKFGFGVNWTLESTPQCEEEQAGYIITRAIELLKDSHIKNSSLCDFYVMDKETGRIHRVGDEQHDAIWVSEEGELHYMNLQNGDGCSGKSHLNEGDGYEFIPSDCGRMGIPFFLDQSEL